MGGWPHAVAGASSTEVVSSDDSALTSQQWKGKTMSKIDELKADIERLPGEEIAELFRWLSEKEWESWDKEIEADSEAGRLDFLVREAREEKAKGALKEI
jgi:hypothetical protein